MTNQLFNFCANHGPFHTVENKFYPSTNTKKIVSQNSTSIKYITNIFLYQWLTYIYLEIKYLKSQTILCHTIKYKRYRKPVVCLQIYLS